MGTIGSTLDLLLGGSGSHVKIPEVAKVEICLPEGTVPPTSSFEKSNNLESQ